MTYLKLYTINEWAAALNQADWNSEYKGVEMANILKNPHEVNVPQYIKIYYLELVIKN